MSAHGSCPYDLTELFERGQEPGPGASQTRHLTPLGLGDEESAPEPFARESALACALSVKPKRKPDELMRFPIASGAVYLAQMMAHDIIQSVPTGNAACPFETNMTRPFMLDSLYGPGPKYAPHLYAIGTTSSGEIDKPGKFRPRFREANFHASSDSPGLARFRHLTSENLAGSIDAVRGNGFVFRNEALIADQRNDSHTILAQLTAVWQRYHNFVYDHPGVWAGGNPDVSTDAGKEKRFEVVKNHLRHVWHRTIREDVIPVILGDKYKHSKDATPLLEASVADPGATHSIDFPPPAALVALRTLHALPLQAYTFAAGPLKPLEGVLGMGSHAVGELNFNEMWRVHWSAFFDGPTTSAPMRTRYDLEHAKDLVTSGEHKKPILLVDFIRSKQLLGTGPQLSREYENLLPNELKAPNREETIQKELAKLFAQVEGGATSLPDADAIAKDPPLSIVLLLEAKISAKGAHLGELGAALLAPWLIGALTKAERATPASTRLPHSISEPSKFFDVLEAIGAVPRRGES